MEIIYLIILGLGVGFLSSVVGLGGGIIIVPFLSLIAGLSVRESVATSLLTVFFIVVFNTIQFSRKKLVQFKEAFYLGLFAGFFSFLAGLLTKMVPVYSIYIVLHLLVTGLLFRALSDYFMLIPKFFHKLSCGGVLVNNRIFLPLVGAVAGGISGFTGIGGGVVIAPVLYFSKISKGTKLVPTTNASMIPIAFFGLLAYIFFPSSSSSQGLLGDVHLSYALILFLSATVSSLIGQKVNSRISENQRVILLSIVLCVVWIKTMSYLLIAFG